MPDLRGRKPNGPELHGGGPQHAGCQIDLAAAVSRHDRSPRRSFDRGYIIHEHICPLPDLPAIRPRPGAECQATPGTRPQGEAGLLRSTRCYLNSTLTPRLRNITYQRETRRGPVLRSNNFICRAMRASIDLDRLGEHTLWVDCDVLEADGGTRTAAITGGSICRLALIVAFSAAGIRDCFLCIVDREYPLVRRTLHPHRRQSALFR